MSMWNRVKKRAPRKARRLKLEALESRQLLTGVVIVNVAASPVPGGVQLLGDADNNAVEMRQGAMTGEYVLTGLNGTLLQLNGYGATMPTVTVNNINDAIQVDLMDGDNAFSLLAPASGGQTSLPTDLLIVNHAGSNVNTLDRVLVNRDVNVSKSSGLNGYSELQILNTTVIGDTIVANDAGGGGGASKTVIDGSQLQGGSTNAALKLTNGYGADVIQIQGASTFGTGGFPTDQVNVVDIHNGDGGSRTTFTGAAKVYGCVNICNGYNLPATQDIVTFNGVEVLGRVLVKNDGGDSLTSVISSKIGTQLVNQAITICGQSVVVPVGGPLVVLNEAGVDQFLMQQSETPWGLYVDNDMAPAKSVTSGNTNLWGSTTNISGSKIGTRPLGPDLQMSSYGGSSTVAGAAMVLKGDNGADSVSVATTTIGGPVDLTVLGNGNNTVSLATSSMSSLWLATGTGNDAVTLDTVTIPVQIDIRLNAGADLLRILGASVLPDSLLGYVVLDGGFGVDTYHQDAAVTPAMLPAINFEVLV